MTSSGKRWGLIGASAIARDWVIPALREAGQEVACVMSRDPDRAAAFAAATEIPTAVASLDALLSAEIDVVYVSTTNERHRAEVEAAAAAGAHVLCEKPLALTVEDAAAMVAACERGGVVLATNHHMRGSGLHRRMAEIVRAGELGRVLSARLLHVGYLPEHLQTWRLTRPDQGGGVFLDLAVHDCDSIRHILGDEPVEVAGLAAQAGMASGALMDSAMFCLRMAGGQLVHVHESFVERHADSRIEIALEGGVLTATKAMAQAPLGALFLTRDGEREPVEVDAGSLYARTIRSFVDAIDGRGAPLASGRDGLRSLQLALTAQDACASGARLPIPSLEKTSP